MILTGIKKMWINMDKGIGILCIKDNLNKNVLKVVQMVKKPRNNDAITLVENKKFNKDELIWRRNMAAKY